MAVITGAGRGLGRAIALRFAEVGAHVTVNDLDSGAADSVVAELRGNGAQAIAVVGDVGRDDDVRAMYEATVEAFGRVDVAVNNAGVVPLRAVGDMTRAEWDRLIAVNTRGAVISSEEASRHMVRLGIRGSIVNVLSVAAVRPLQRELLAYSVSKAGLRIATEVLALALAEHGIRVNGLLPTVMQTDSTRAIPALKVPTVPLGRLPEPDEVARAAVFLASDMAAFVTGVVLPVDGGRLLT